MPPLPDVPGVIRVVIQCQGNDGRKAENVVHFQYTGSLPGADDVEGMAEVVWTGWTNSMTGAQPAQTSLVSVTVTDLSSNTGAQAVYTNGGVPVPGSSSHGMLPLNTAALITFGIGIRYRGGHPRIYLPIGTTDDLNDDGDWKESSYSNWGGFWLNIVEGLQTASPYGTTTVTTQCAISYVSKEENPVKPYRRAVPLIYSIDNGNYYVPAQLATIRRRVRRAGHRA